MIPQKFYHIDSKTLCNANSILHYINRSPGLMISIIWDCHIRSFTSPIIILCKKLFLLCRESKAAEISNLFFFLFISFNSCRTHRSNFWILSNCFNWIDIVVSFLLMTPNLSADFSCVWIGFSLSNSSNSPLSNFFGASERSSSSKLKFPTFR